MKRKMVMLMAAFLYLIGIGDSLTAFAGEEMCLEKDSEALDDGKIAWENELFDEAECFIDEMHSAEEAGWAEESDDMYLSQEMMLGDGGNASEEERIPIDETHFPDENFRNYLKEAAGSEDYIQPGKIDALLLENMEIKDLEGIQYFSNLTRLICEGNHLQSLDVSKNEKLAELNCAGNYLMSLNVRGCGELTKLNCVYNQLSGLNVGNCEKLTELYCDFNQMTKLDVSDCVSLEKLHCSFNQLPSLQVENCRSLTELICGSNELSGLNVNNCEKLMEIGCPFNLLTRLDVENCRSLMELNCVSNRLTGLDVKCCGNLTVLACGDNHLTSLDVSKNGKLESFACVNNQSEIKIDRDNRFDLFALPGGFDVSRASVWSGGQVDGNTLIVDAGAEKVTYSYDAGNGHWVNFTLLVTKSEEGTTPAPGPSEAPGEPTVTPTRTPAEPTQPLSQPTAAPTPTAALPPLTKAPEKPRPGQTLTVGSVKYQVKAGNTLEMVGGNKKAKSITIPASVTKNGLTYKVTSIRNNAFQNYKNLQKVTIGKEVTKIGKNAFSGCTKLSKVTIQTTKLKTVGKNAFKGIKKTAVIKVPKKQYAKYKKYLKASKLNTSVKIKK